jgi:hypothetical protein
MEGKMDINSFNLFSSIFKIFFIFIFAGALIIILTALVKVYLYRTSGIDDSKKKREIITGIIILVITGIITLIIYLKYHNYIMLGISAGLSLGVILTTFGSKILGTLKKYLRIRKLEKENAGDIKNIDYYRDDFKKYSPAELAFCMKDNITMDSIMATILSLINRGLVETTEDGLVMTKDSANYKPTELYIINNQELIMNCFEAYKKHQNYKSSLSLYREAAISELQNDNLIINDAKVNNYSLASIPNALGFLAFLCAIVNNFINMTNIGNLDNFSIMMGLPFLAFFSIMVSIVTGKSRDAYIRSKEGNNLQTKLYALKRYLKESNLADKSIEELKVWDNYMICAILFNLKGRLDKETDTKINEIFKNTKFYNYIFIGNVLINSFKFIFAVEFIFIVVIFIIVFMVINSIMGLPLGK